MKSYDRIIYLAGPSAKLLCSGADVIIPFPGSIPAEFDNLCEARHFLDTPWRNTRAQPYAVWERSLRSNNLVLIHAEPITGFVQQAFANQLGIRRGRA